MAEISIFIGQSDKQEELFLSMANRHGFVTGATGTGKTVTLQRETVTERVIKNVASTAGRVVTIAVVGTITRELGLGGRRSSSGSGAGSIGASVIRSVGTQLVRGILGSLTRR